MNEPKVIDYPKVRLRNGQTYKVRMSLAAMKLQEEWKVSRDNPTNTTEAWTQLCGQLASAAYTNGDGPMTHAGLTPEAVDSIYGGDPDISEMADLRSAVNAAIFFRLPPAGQTAPSETATMS